MLTQGRQFYLNPEMPLAFQLVALANDYEKLEHRRPKMLWLHPTVFAKLDSYDLQRLGNIKVEASRFIQPHNPMFGDE